MMDQKMYRIPTASGTEQLFEVCVQFLNCLDLRFRSYRIFFLILISVVLSFSAFARCELGLALNDPEIGREIKFDPSVPLTSGTDQEIKLEISVFLEGPFDTDFVGMKSVLHEKGYLPGLEPSTFFGSREPSGQPYFKQPWEYQGNEGKEVLKARELYPYGSIDWVLVSLRYTEDVSSEVCRVPGILLDDGSVYFRQGWGTCQVDIEESYYVVVEHRNHLMVMSPTAISAINGSISCDFRYNQSYTSLVGYGQKEVVPGVYAMYAGNVSQKGTTNASNDINYEDFYSWLKMNGKNSAYLTADVDLDGDVNIRDSQYVLSNIGVFSDVLKDY